MTYGKFTTLLTIQHEDLNDLDRRFTFIFATEDDGVQSVVFECDSMAGREVINAQLYAVTNIVGEQNAEAWQEAISVLRAEFG